MRLTSCFWRISLDFHPFVGRPIIFSLKTSGGRLIRFESNAVLATKSHGTTRTESGIEMGGTVRRGRVRPVGVVMRVALVITLSEVKGGLWRQKWLVGSLVERDVDGGNVGIAGRFADAWCGQLGQGGGGGVVSCWVMHQGSTDVVLVVERIHRHLRMRSLMWSLLIGKRSTKWRQSQLNRRVCFWLALLISTCAGGSSLYRVLVLWNRDWRPGQAKVWPCFVSFSRDDSKFSYVSLSVESLVLLMRINPFALSWECSVYVFVGDEITNWRG